MTFRKISEINPSSPESYEDAIFLTFDIDWACDDVVLDTIELVEKADVAATWYVTHNTQLLERLKENPKFELGIHPNFNPLFSGERSTDSCSYDIIKSAMQIVPEALSMRSHSLTFSSIVQQQLKDFGIKYELNLFVPHQSNCNVLYPIVLWDGLVRVPYLFCDYVSAIYGFYDIENILRRQGLKVFDFHPIHVYMNTESIAEYEIAKQYSANPQVLKSKRNKYRSGSRFALKELLGLNDE